MRRWLVLVLGLALAAAAALALATFQRGGGAGARDRAGLEEPGVPDDDIDEASRQRLLEVLREESEP